MQLPAIKTIAIFRALQLGDLLCVIPSIRVVRKKFPLAKITLIGLSWQKDLVSRFENYFDEFIEFAGWPGLLEQSWEAEKTVVQLGNLQQRHFDLVIQMQGNGILTNSMCLLWNAKLTIGLKRHGEPDPGPGIFVESEDSDHETLRYLKLVNCLDTRPDDDEMEFPLTPSETDRLEHNLKKLNIKQKKYICIHPGARDPRRRWPVENFAQLIDALNTDLALVLTGSGFEKQLLLDLQQALKREVVNSVSILGDIPLGDLAAIISSSSMLISNDTGVSHLAVALKVPSVVIFSTFSDPNRWAPLERSLHRSILYPESHDVKHVIDICRQQIQEADSLFLDEIRTDDERIEGRSPETLDSIPR